MSTDDEPTASDWQPDVTDRRTCQHCGAHVSKSYWRAWSVDGELTCCPQCEDRVRGRHNQVREARSTTNQSVESRYDPEYGLDQQ